MHVDWRFSFNIQPHISYCWRFHFVYARNWVVIYIESPISFSIFLPIFIYIFWTTNMPPQNWIYHTNGSPINHFDGQECPIFYWFMFTKKSFVANGYHLMVGVFFLKLFQCCSFIFCPPFFIQFLCSERWSKTMSLLKYQKHLSLFRSWMLIDYRGLEH